MVWARLLSEEDTAAHFPDGGFTAHWGSIVTVASNDFLSVPYPDGGEVYVIPGQLFVLPRLVLLMMMLARPLVLL